MKHSFDTEVAKKYGVEIAIMFEMFCFWISKNEANNMNYHDGKYWTYNSQKGMENLFPYFGESRTRRTLEKMLNLDILVKGNYNENPYNRTSWYAFGETGEKLRNALNTDLANLTNGYVKNDQCTFGKNDECTFGKNDECKTVIYTVNNTVNKRNIKESSNDTSLLATETIPYVEIIDYLNEKCLKTYKHKNRIAREKIHARWCEGFRLDDFKRVIDVKSAEWLKDENMNKYLRPDTLFGTKFEIYLNSSLPKQENKFVFKKGVKM